MKSLKKYLDDESRDGSSKVLSESPVVMHSKPKSRFKDEDVFYDAVEDADTSPVFKQAEDTPVKVNCSAARKSFGSSSKPKVSCSLTHRRQPNQ